MALVYGLLGLLAVVAGSQFGTLNSSPWFNGAITALFVVMGLAMFDIVQVDLSRFQKGGQVNGARRGGLLPAVVMGAVMALLAGACVAPVVISVLLLAVDFHAGGNAAGLLLPFLLGVGMALPWPFAGAGLSFLPKPGQWMTHVKHAFGVLIMVFALRYAYLTYRILAPQPEVDTAGWVTDLEAGVEQAKREGKPVFIDFWAVWCSNCKRMEATTLKDPAVLKILDGFVKVKHRCEFSSDAGSVLKRFGWEGTYGGLPVYATLGPETREE
jgi:thiol:disulfide interchange protein